jgi:flagellar M-ring protein FliF
MKAVGYNEERGDQIEVSNIPFETERLTEEDKKAMAREGLLRNVWKVVPYIVTLLLIALLIVLVLRPLVKWLTGPATGVASRVSAGRVRAELEGEMPALLTGEVGMPREQVTQLARADAGRFAELLKNWIGEV